MFFGGVEEVVFEELCEGVIGLCGRVCPGPLALVSQADLVAYVVLELSGRGAV